MKNRGLGRSERHPFHPSPSLLAFTLCIWLLMIFSQRAAPLSDLEAPPQSPSSRFMYFGAKGLPRMTFLSRQLTFSVCLPGGGAGERGGGGGGCLISSPHSSLMTTCSRYSSRKLSYLGQDHQWPQFHPTQLGSSYRTPPTAANS